MKAAGLGRRLASLLYESMLLLATWLSLVVFPHTIAAFLLGFAAPGWFVWGQTFLVLGALYVWLWCTGRQTLPMKTWKLRLLTEDGLPLAPSHALMRYFWAWPSYGLAGIGILWAFFDSEGKFLHDRLARTNLVDDTKRG
jgi:uncharacterized RDD family membrane protein YckC